MDSIAKGLIAGLLFGLVSATPMFFMKFDDKKAAIIAAFLNRFAIGFIIFNLQLPAHGIIKGILVSLILSLPEALITKAYKPIMGIGLLGGIVCGYFA